MRFSDVFKSDNDKMMRKKNHNFSAVMKVEINSPAYYLFIQLI